MNSRWRSTSAILAALLLGAMPRLGSAQVGPELVHGYLWPQSPQEFEQASSSLGGDPSLEGLTRFQWLDLEELMRQGRPAERYVANIATRTEAGFSFDVAGPDGRSIPIFVRLPERYTPDTEWPLMLAMHGGPPGSAEGAVRSAARMIDVWAESADRAGWIVVSPAMVSTVSRDGRTSERLPYEIFHPEEAKAVVDAVRERFNVDPDRIVSTGISLGSNFSIGFGAAHPDRFSAIVPVSTEGDSREHLLRNLMSVPTYVLEGSQDRNIRGVGGPRSFAAILTSYGYDLVYREFGDRAHEGFQEHYPDVLRWLGSRPRERAPREVIRVPHEAIMPVSRRIHWIESDTRQALVRARIVGPHEIDITAAWARELTLYLNDRLVDMDGPLTVRVNGEVVFEGSVRRSARVALEEARRLGDERRIYAARLTVALPTSGAAIKRGQALWRDLEPTHPEGVLSFWEMYAARALVERFPSVGFDGDEVPLPMGFADAAPEQVAVRVTSVETDGPVDDAGLREGDLLLSVGGEPFFAGRGGVAGLHSWITRELRETPAEYEMTVWREGAEVRLSTSLALGPYRPPAD